MASFVFDWTRGIGTSPRESLCKLVDKKAGPGLNRDLEYSAASRSPFNDVEALRSPDLEVSLDDRSVDDSTLSQLVGWKKLSQSDGVLSSLQLDTKQRSRFA
jgi:hypothetical protein